MNCGCLPELSRQRLERLGITQALSKKSNADVPVTQPPSKQLAKARADLAAALARATVAEEKIVEKDTELEKARADLSALLERATKAEADLKQCREDKCPEANVISIGDVVVFSGFSCDTMEGLSGDMVVGENTEG